MIVYLKNGAFFETDDVLSKLARNNLSGDLMAVEWNPNGPRRLKYLNLEEVIAIINVASDGEEQAVQS